MPQEVQEIHLLLVLLKEITGGNGLKGLQPNGIYLVVEVVEVLLEQMQVLSQGGPGGAGAPITAV
jgi:hypothetical protein